MNSRLPALILGLTLPLAAARGASVDTGRMQRMAALLGAEPTLDKGFLDGAERAEQAVDELVREALRGHPALSAERKAHEAREAGVNAASANAYQPKLAVVGSAGESRNKDLDASQEAKARTTSYGLSLRQNLWRGGRDALDVSLAEADEKLAGVSEKLRTEAVRFNVRRAALQYNYQAMQQLLAEESAKDAAELRRLSEKKFGAGQVGKIDVHQATMRETDAQATAAKSRLQTRQGYYALLRALGYDGEPSAGASSALDSLTKASLPFPRTLPILEAKRPPTLAEDNAQLAASKAELAASSATRARYLPEIDLSASATRSQERTESDLGVSTDKNLRLGAELDLTWPLWERALDHRATAAALDREAAAAKAVDARAGAELSAKELRQKVEDLYAALPIYRTAFVEAGNLFDARLKLYEAGAIDIFVVTESDSQRLGALRTWYDAVYEIRLALLKWKALEAGYVPDP